jgi:hypothetical protein
MTARVLCAVAAWFLAATLAGAAGLSPKIQPGPLEALITAGYCGLFVLIRRRSFARAEPVALRDPFLGESLQHSQ